MNTLPMCPPDTAELFSSLPSSLQKQFGEIELLVLDFDGTLTDNLVLTFADRTECVRADRGDGLGLELLRKHCQINVIILSKETNPVTKARADKLNIPCTHGIEVKIDNFRHELDEHNCNAAQVCFVGNDLNDIECIQAAGIGVAVADAYVQVKKVADYVTTRPGGHGAVREICEFIMYAQRQTPLSLIRSRQGN